MMRSHWLAAFTAAFLLLASATPAAARTYDVHVYRVTAVNLEHRVQTTVDGQPRVDGGAALDGTATWRTTIRGPVGRFSIAGRDANNAFLRIGLNGNLGAHANATAGVQGSWTETEIQSSDAGPVTQTRQGTCSGQDRPTRIDLDGRFLRRRGGVYSFLLVTPRGLSGGGSCPVEERGRDPATLTAVGTIRPGAGTRTLRINYRRSRHYTEDGAVVDETRSLTGTIVMRRVKFCPFRRGFNQFGCAGGNPDSLG